MNKFVLSLLVCITMGSSFNVFAKKACQDPSTMVPFGQVMNPAFVKKFKKCPVTTEAEFVTFGVLPGVPIPGKMKKKIIIQAVQPGTLTNNTLMPGYLVGLPKKLSDQVFNLKKGQKIKLRGVTYQWGLTAFAAAMSGHHNTLHYFLASSVEVIE